MTSGRGRPTKYKAKYIKMMLEYFGKPSYESWVKKEVIKANGTVEKEYALKPAKLPTIFSFSRQIGVNDDTIVEWAKKKTSKGSKKLKYPEFSAAYNAAHKLQKEFLINNALSGMSPPASYIFTAKNITDMTDKTEVDHTTKGQAMKFVEVSFADAMAELDRRKKEKETQATLEDSNAKPVTRPQ